MRMLSRETERERRSENGVTVMQEPNDRIMENLTANDRV